MIDLVVAGGGPAGLATALYAARAGLEVTIVERRSGVLDKACGEGMMPHTIDHLTGLGLALDGWPLRGISYLDGDHRVDATFRSATGLGVRRTVLHEALKEAAEDAGVQFVHDSVTAVSQDATSVRVGKLQARYLAAADGLHSPIRRSLGLDAPTRGPKRWGIRRHVRIAPWTDYVEVHWASGAEAYVTPVADDCVGIAILSSTRGGFDDHFAEFPALRARVTDHDHEPDRAAGPLRQRARGRTAGRVMLVGDAAGYVDALTGEGLGLAFGAARQLVECVVADRPGDYDRRWRHVTRRYRLMTAGLVRATGNARVRAAVVPAAVAMPRIFATAVHQLAH